MIRKIYKNKFRKDLLFSYIVQGLILGLGFLQLFLITKYFGIEIYGQLSIIIASAGVFSVLLTARSNEAITRFFTREVLNDNLSNAKFTLLMGFMIDLFFALILLLSIYFLSQYIAEYFLKDTALAKEVYLYSYVVFFIFIRGTILGYLQSNEFFISIYSITLLEMILKNALLIILVTFKDIYTLDYLIYILVFSAFISYLFSLLLFIIMYKKQFINTPLLVNKELFQEYIKFNVKTFLSSSLKAGNKNMDSLLIGYFVNAQSVGIYQIIKKILSPITFLVKPFKLLTFPKLIKYFEQDKIEKFKRLIAKISFYISLVILFYIVIVYFSFEFILSLLNTPYQFEYSQYLVLLSYVSLVISMQWWARVFSNIINPNYSIVSNLFATSFHLTATVILTKYFLLTGMLFSYMILNTLLFIYWLIKIKQLKGKV